MNQHVPFAAWQVASPHFHPEAAARAQTAERRGLSLLAPLLLQLYRLRRLRGLVRRVCWRLEAGRFFSVTWRRILHETHGVSVGRYSYGAILMPGVLPPGSSVGNYCSVGQHLLVHRIDHPLDRPSLHPFFYNAVLGMLERDTIPDVTDNPLTIGHDVWIGDRVTILAGCRRIGNGAVLAAGAVVTHDVPPYTIVAGVPARTLRQRLDPARIQQLEESGWWERSLAELIEDPPVAGLCG